MCIFQGVKRHCFRRKSFRLLATGLCFGFGSLETMSSRGEHQTVPLSVLLKRELANEKIEKPEIVSGQASRSKKGEDFTLLKTECERVMGDGVTTFSVFGVWIFVAILMTYFMIDNKFAFTGI